MRLESRHMSHVYLERHRSNALHFVASKGPLKSFRSTQRSSKVVTCRGTARSFVSHLYRKFKKRERERKHARHTYSLLKIPAVRNGGDSYRLVQAAINDCLQKPQSDLEDKSFSRFPLADVRRDLTYASSFVPSVVLRSRLTR